jgi:hypothetical protein
MSTRRERYGTGIVLLAAMLNFMLFGASLLVEIGRFFISVGQPGWYVVLVGTCLFLGILPLLPLTYTALVVAGLQACRLFMTNKDVLEVRDWILANPKMHPPLFSGLYRAALRRMDSDR